MIRAHDDRAERLGGALRSRPVPGEREALERAVALAAETAAGASRVRPPRRRRVRGGAAAVAAVLIAALALSPAGATVGNWIEDAVDDAPVPARTSLGHVPGGGELVVQSAEGPWVVQADGSRRLLGDYETATWSPRGLYLAVTRGRTLTAVEPDGDPHWSIDTPGEARDPRWSPSGQRIAYRSAGDLHVVAGDGTVDRTIGPVAPHVAPAWMPVTAGPYSRNVVAYADTPVSVRVIDSDTGGLLARSPLPSSASYLSWLDRNHVLVAGRSLLGVVDVRADAGRFTQVPVPPGGNITGVAASPAGRRIAVTSMPPRRLGPRRTVLRVGRLDYAQPLDLRYRRFFAGLGSFDPPLFSPDGSQVLLPWRSGNQWVFFDAARRHPSPFVIGNVARQFSPGAERDDVAFPHTSGWCCP
jgi:hypothetical protein